MSATRQKLAEPIKFVTKKFLYNKESNELELEFSIRNISQERVMISGIEVENLGIFRGKVEKLVEFAKVATVKNIKDEVCLIFSNVFQKHQLNRYSLLNDSLLLSFTTGSNSYDLDPDELVLFMIKITCVRTIEEIEEVSELHEITPVDFQPENVHVFNLITYCRYSTVEDTDIRHCIQSDKIYSITTSSIDENVWGKSGVLSLRLRGLINIPAVINPDLRLKPKAIIEYHSETIEQFLKRMITKYDLKTENKLFSFANILKKLKKLNGEVIDEYLRELSKTGDMDIQNKVSRILKAISNEPVLKEKGRWKKFFHTEG